MLVVKTYVAPSGIHGVGVFAAEPINCRQIIWERNTVIDCEIMPYQLATLPPVAQAAALARSFVIRETGAIILSRDQAVFINHSDSPNLGNDGRALRNINVGEEITEDYRHHGRGACREFLDTVLPSGGDKT